MPEYSQAFGKCPQAWIEMQDIEALSFEKATWIPLAAAKEFILHGKFGTSRKTGYKHLERYAADGLKGLAVRSHRLANLSPGFDRQSANSESGFAIPRMRSRHRAKCNCAPGFAKSRQFRVPRLKSAAAGDRRSEEILKEFCKISIDTSVHALVVSLHAW